MKKITKTFTFLVHTSMVGSQVSEDFNFEFDENLSEKAIQKIVEEQFKDWLLSNMTAEVYEVETKNHCIRCDVKVESGFWCNECVMYK